VKRSSGPTAAVGLIIKKAKSIMGLGPGCKSIIYENNVEANCNKEKPEKNQTVVLSQGKEAKSPSLFKLEFVTAHLGSARKALLFYTITFTDTKEPLNPM